MLQKTSQHDARGVPVSDCAPQSLQDYETALQQFRSYFGDPTETLTETLQQDPEFVMGHIFMANALLMMTERQYLPMIRDSIEAAEALSNKANHREKMLMRAARHWMEGRWDKAGAIWDQVLAEYPHDAMTLQCAHLTDFYLGDALNLRDRVARVIGHWSKDTPGYSFVVGMQAFGFEECNQYHEAESAARAALETEPRDPWSVHALTHVFEMQNRFEEGQKFLRDTILNWAPDNGFAFHNWWHLGLFHIEQADFEGALKLYDDEVFAEEADVSLQLLDATALLWRLHLQDFDLGNRWKANANLWSNKLDAETGYYAFNDFHAVIALVADGRISEAEQLVKAMKASAKRTPGVTAMMIETVGIPGCSAMINFAKGNYRKVIDQLYPIRSVANRFGGSHAQRDIMTQTLFEAAVRSGNAALASNLINERSVQKPSSPLSQRMQRKMAN